MPDHCKETTLAKGYIPQEAVAELGMFRFVNEIPERHYMNYLTLTHSAAEFVFDFGKLLPGATKAQHVVGLVVAPSTIKEFSKLLDKEITDYEKSYGKIYTEPDKKKAGEKERQMGFHKTTEKTEEEPQETVIEP